LLAKQIHLLYQHLFLIDNVVVFGTIVVFFGSIIETAV